MSKLDEQIRDITTRMFAYGIDWTEFKDKSKKDHTVSTYAGKIKQSMADEVRKDITKLIANQVRKARIDELYKLSLYRESDDRIDVDFIDWQTIENRLAELKGDDK